MKNKLLLGGILVTAAMFIGGVVASPAGAQVVTPSTPNVTATLTPSNQVSVSWGASSETAKPGVMFTYYLYRNGVQIAITAGGTYLDDVPAGQYSYSVMAIDQTGAMSQRSSASAPVTVLPDSIAPTTPTDLTVTAVSSTAMLTWNPSTDNYAVVGYYVYRNGVLLPTKNPITGTTYTDTGLDSPDTYTYSVAAYDASTNLSNHSNVVKVTTLFDNQPPSAPVAATAAAVSANQINIKWLPASDNVQVAGYYIYRNNVQIGTTTSTAFNDMTVLPGTLYGYTIYAYDELGNVSAQGVSANANSLAPDTTAPSTPREFYAVANSASQVTLTWDPSADNVGVVGYYISLNGTRIASVTSTSYVATNLTTSTLYQFFITSYDAAGNVSPPASLAVTTLSYNPVISPAATPTPISTPAPVASPNGTGSGSASLLGSSHFVFTGPLYYGLRSTDVKNLQTLLVQQGYLASIYATGFYGTLTLQAVQKFQCSQNIVCSGSPGTTGWGAIGPKTRRVLNAL